MSDLIQIRVPERYEHYRIINTGKGSCIEQKGMSWAARGLHAYLLTRGTSWKIYKSELLSRATDGRRSLDKALKELKRAGYLRVRQKRDSQGRFQTIWEVYDEPPPTHNGAGKSQTPTAHEKTISEPHARFRRAVDGTAVNGTAVTEHLPNRDVPIDEATKGGESLSPRSASRKASSSIRSQFDCWIREHGQPLYSRIFGEKAIFPKDASVLSRIRFVIEDSSFSWKDVTERYERYLRLDEPALRNCGYPFAWFLDRFNSLGHKTTSIYQPKTFEIVR